MFKRSTTALFVASAFFLFTRCSEQDDKLKAPLGKMVALVDGNKFESSSIACAIEVQNTYFSIQGVAQNGDFINLYIPGFRTGDFELYGAGVPKIGGASFYRFLEPAQYDLFCSCGVNRTITGAVVITELDETEAVVSGTFYSTMRGSNNRTIEVTNGSFNRIKYTDPNNSGSYMINGERETAVIVRTYVANGIRVTLNGKTKLLSLLVSASGQTGTFKFEGAPPNQYGATLNVSDQFFTTTGPESGSYTISKIDLSARRIEGTFDIKMMQISGAEIIISDGKFAANF